jgi:hypothetical protein
MSKVTSSKPWRVATIPGPATGRTVHPGLEDRNRLTDELIAARTGKTYFMKSPCRRHRPRLPRKSAPSHEREQHRREASGS